MKKALHLIPYKQIFPPKGGGQLRSFHIMDELAKYMSLTVLSYQSPAELKQMGYNNNHNINFIFPQNLAIQGNGIQGKVKKIINAINYRILRRSTLGPAQSEVLDFAPLIKLISKTSLFDTIIFEHMSTTLLAPICKRYFPRSHLIYDAHNVDYKLISNASIKEKTIKLESNIYKHVNTFWACSEKDRDELEQLNKFKIKGAVVPNGVSIKNRPFCKEKSNTYKKIIFCGTLDYPPNIEGLTWFLKNCWQQIKIKIPKIELYIVGRGDNQWLDSMVNDSQIKITGEVADLTEYYHKCFVSIVPLLSGSGTRLKILEAMSYGNPVISTTIGAEGINYTNNKNIIIADSAEKFVEKIHFLIEHQKQSEQIINSARELIENNYIWNIIGKKIITNIENM